MKKILLSLVLFHCTLFVFAQDLEIEGLISLSLEELMQLPITTATGTEQTLKTVPAVATVITAADIEKLGVSTLDEALEIVAGLHVRPSGIAYLSSIWSIRGIYTNYNNQCLLLINGIPFRDITFGGPGTLYRMPVAMISRIEVIFGPGSALYGADAFSGIVNVITKNAGEIKGTNTGIRYGSFNTHDIWVQHGGSYNGWDIALSIENLKSDGDKNRIVERDFLGRGAPSLTPTYMDTEYEITDTRLNVKKENLNMNLYYSWQESAMGPGGIQVITYENKSSIRYLTGDITYNNTELIQDWDLSVRLNGAYRYDEWYGQYFPQTYRNMIGNVMWRTKQNAIEVSGLCKVFKDHQLKIGSGVQYFSMEWDQYKNFGPGMPSQFGAMYRITNTPYATFIDHSRSDKYAFIQDEWGFAENWVLTGGVRYDNYNDFGSTTNPRIAIVWNTTETFSTKLLYGEAFCAPSFTEQYAINNPIILGNPDIKPEEIKTYELVFGYNPFINFRVDLSIYTYKTTGLIDYVKDPFPATTTRTQNINDNKGDGFELKLCWDIIKTIQLRSSFSHQKSENENTNYDIQDTPGNKFYTDLEWNIYTPMSIVMQYYRIGDRKRARIDSRDEIDDYDLVNLILRYKTEHSITIAAGVKNVFDKDIREPSDGRIPGDYPMETRSYFGEVRYNF